MQFSMNFATKLREFSISITMIEHQFYAGGFMDNQYTESEHAFARLIGLPNDPDALGLARRLRSLNQSSDEVRQKRALRAVQDAMGDIRPIKKRRRRVA